MASNKVQLIDDCVTYEVFGTSLCVVARPYDNDAWIVEATDQKFEEGRSMPIQWQMIAPTGKREAVRIAKKVVDVYIDFGCFLSTRTDEARVVEECIKTEDARGLRLVAALHQGDDKAQSRKTLERVIKLLGLNKPSKKAIARQQEIMEGWRQLAEDLKSGVAFKNVLVPRN